MRCRPILVTVKEVMSMLPYFLSILSAILADVIAHRINKWFDRW